MFIQPDLILLSLLALMADFYNGMDVAARGKISFNGDF
jgi:hypothetical protein